jgi:hypothetical protein
MTSKRLGAAGAIWFLWSVALSTEPGALGQIKDPLADVTIYPVGEDGLGVPLFHVERFTSRDGEDYSAKFRGLRAAGIPEGTYDFVLKRPDSGGGVNITGRASLFEPSSLVVVPVSRSEVSRLSRDRIIQSRGFEIRGTLAHVPADTPPSEPLRVRLISLYGTGQFDLSVDASGEFRIHNALEGRYLLLAIRGDTVLGIRQISFDEDGRSADFVIDLSQAPSPILHVQASQR